MSRSFRDVHKKLYNAFVTQRNNAKDRGIEFLLTFEEWLSTWQDSGHLHERGKKLDQYCMARFGDQGPYAVGNIKIILHSENVREAQIGNIYNVGKKLTEDHRKNIGNSVRGQKLPKFTEEHRLNISRARKELFDTRRSLGMPIQTEEVRNHHSEMMEAYWQKVRQEGGRKVPEVSEETRMKRSAAMKGHKFSDKVKKQRSIRIKAWHVERKLKKAANE